MASNSLNYEVALKKKLQLFLQEMAQFGTLQGFKHFSCYVRGKEELLITVNNSLQSSSSALADSTSRRQSLAGYSDSFTSSQLPYDKRSLLLSHNTQKGLSNFRDEDVGLPPASPSELESPTGDDVTMFLLAGYARYSCPYVWVRSNHDRLFRLSGNKDGDKDSPLRLKSTARWKDGDIKVADIVAEVVKLSTFPAPRNPFEVDLEYFHSLTQPEQFLSSGAMTCYLQKVVVHTPSTKYYAGKVFEELGRVSKFHFNSLRELIAEGKFQVPQPKPTEQILMTSEYLPSLHGSGLSSRQRFQPVPTPKLNQPDQSFQPSRPSHQTPSSQVFNPSPSQVNPQQQSQAVHPAPRQVMNPPPHQIHSATSQVQHLPSTQVQHLPSQVLPPSTQVQHPPSQIFPPSNQIQHPPSQNLPPSTQVQHPPSQVMPPSTQVQHPPSQNLPPSNQLQHPPSQKLPPSTQVQHPPSTQVQHSPLQVMPPSTQLQHPPSQMLPASHAQPPLSHHLPPPPSQAQPPAPHFSTPAVLLTSPTHTPVTILQTLQHTSTSPTFSTVSQPSNAPSLQSYFQSSSNFLPAAMPTVHAQTPTTHPRIATPITPHPQIAIPTSLHPQIATPTSLHPQIASPTSLHPQVAPPTSLPPRPTIPPPTSSFNPYQQNFQSTRAIRPVLYPHPTQQPPLVNTSEPRDVSGITYGRGPRGAFPGGFERTPAPSMF